MPFTAQLPIIRGLLPMTLIDWPGHIAAVVFLPGCNLRCGYCHSGSLLDATPDEQIPFREVQQYLHSKRNWLDGVVICGGEPTLHPTLANLCHEIRDMKLAVKLDTNGTRPNVLAQLLADGLIDGVSLDVKTRLDGQMSALARTNVDIAAIEQSIDLLMGPLARDIDVEFRTTCCPAYVDVDVVRWIAARVARKPAETVASGGAPSYLLQRFSPEHCLDPALREVRPYNGTEMEALLTAAREVNPNTRLRGQ